MPLGAAPPSPPMTPGVPMPPSLKRSSSIIWRAADFGGSAGAAGAGAA
jgi:hypothetical protein